MDQKADLRHKKLPYFVHISRFCLASNPLYVFLKIYFTLKEISLKDETSGKLKGLQIFRF